MSTTHTKGIRHQASGIGESAPSPVLGEVAASAGEGSASTGSPSPRSHPILFSAPMVRALLEGKKTQTRRIVKPAHIKFLSDGVVMPRDFADIASFTPHQKAFEARLVNYNMILGLGVCPYGQPGDRLWVRETWREANDQNDRDCIVYEADGVAHHIAFDGEKPRIDATALDPEIYSIDEGPKKPSIHMPRWASRLTLEITSIRVERVQEISLRDINAEGIPVATEDGAERDPFVALWTSINGHDSWDQNPWVWVVGFKRVGTGCGA